MALLADSAAFKQLDLSLSKRFGTGAGAFTIRADVLDVFNWTNDSYDTNPFGGVGVAPGKAANSLGLDNLSLNKAIGIRGPTRTLKLSGNYSF